MTTFVFENVNWHYDFICSGVGETQAREELKRKLLKVHQDDSSIPLGGWLLKNAHNDEHSDPSMDRGVQWTDWDFR